MKEKVDFIELYYKKNLLFKTSAFGYKIEFQKYQSFVIFIGVETLQKIFYNNINDDFLDPIFTIIHNGNPLCCKLNYIDFDNLVGTKIIFDVIYF